MSLVNIISLASTILLAIFFIRRFRTTLNSRDSMVMIICFLVAVIPVIPAQVIKYTASEFHFNEHLPSLFGKIGYGIFLGFLFEIHKYIVIVAYAFRQREFDEPLSGIIITILIGLGFTLGENAWYMLSGNEDYSGTWRVLFSIPVSIVCAVVMGFYTGMSKYGLDTDDLGSFGLRMRGLGMAILFHSFYNFFLFMEDYKSLVPLIVAGCIFMAVTLGLNILRARRLHTRLIYSRKRREKNWGSN